MTDSRLAIKYEIAAYRAQEEPGWRLVEAWGDIDVSAGLQSQGIRVAEVRTIRSGLCHLDKERSGISSLDFFTYDYAIEDGWSWDHVASTWRAPDEPILNLPGRPTVVSDIDVNFGETEFGWQPVFFSAGDSSASFRASELFDPFPEILQWLEATARGEHRRVIINQEGSYRELLALPAGDQERVRIAIAHASHWEDNFREINLDIDIDRYRFVEAYYNALRAHAQSKNYDPNQWAAIPLKDDLASKGFPLTPEQMSTCKAASLNDILWKLYPRYRVSFPGETGERQMIRRFIDYALRRQRPADMVEEPNPQFVVPAEFDAWDAKRRAAFINELLEESVTNWGAFDLRKLRSAEIEAYPEIR